MESDEKEDDFDSSEINVVEVRVAELQASPPYVCASLKPVKGKEKANTSNQSYSFDITKAYQIFDVLLRINKLFYPKERKCLQ